MAEASGNNHSEGTALMRFVERFPTGAKAEEWFIKQRWPHGVRCPYCGSRNVQVGCKHRTMPFRCREKACGRKRFSTKTRTVMECSNLGYVDWLAAMFLMTISLESVSSTKLHRDLGVTQKTAWFLAHRIRYAFAQGRPSFKGPVEVDNPTSVASAGR